MQKKIEELLKNVNELIEEARMEQLHGEALGLESERYKNSLQSEIKLQELRVDLVNAYSKAIELN